MRTFRLDKLVRDGIVKSTEDQGGIVDYVVVTGQHKTDLLLAKLKEETAEFDVSRQPAELAQILGVILAIADELGFTQEELLAIEQVKQQKMGGYDAGHFVRTITLPEDNHWAKYYAADPDRFPEIDPNA